MSFYVRTLEYVPWWYARVLYRYSECMYVCVCARDRSPNIYLCGSEVSSGSSHARSIPWSTLTRCFQNQHSVSVNMIKFKRMDGSQLPAQTPKRSCCVALGPTLHPTSTLSLCGWCGTRGAFQTAFGTAGRITRRKRVCCRQIIHILKYWWERAYRHAKEYAWTGGEVVASLGCQSVVDCGSYTPSHSHKMAQLLVGSVVLSHDRPSFRPVLSFAMAS